MRTLALLALLVAQAHASPCPAPPPPEIVKLPGKAVAIAARQAHACALLADGHVWCWGNNEWEQAGSTARAQATPPHDLGLEHVVEISLGDTSGCARHADGTTTCWGRKTWWNQSLPQSLAARPPKGERVDHVAAGADHACAIVHGNVECYGSFGSYGGFPEDQPRVPGISAASAIAAGDRDDCAIEGGAVLCWGQPWIWSCDAQCEREKSRPVAHRVPGIDDAIAVSVGAYDACAVRRSGQVACWGARNGSHAGTVTPVAIPMLRAARQVAVGERHACALDSGGAISCWGEGIHGERGDGRTDELGETPSPVAGITGATAIAAGSAMSCALLAGGRVTCWGLDHDEQLGFTRLVHADAPVATCGLDRVKQLAASYVSTCALRRDGSVWCWGAGWGWRDHSAVPRAQPLARRIVEVVGGDPGVCAIDRDRVAHCWSTWANGVLVPPGTRVKDVAIGAYGTCWIGDDDGVRCNGKPVSGLHGKAEKLAVGDRFACALIGDRVTCWGPGAIITPPEICTGDVCRQDGPEPLVHEHPLRGVVDVATRGHELCARTRDGVVRCTDAREDLDDHLPVATDDPWSPAMPPGAPAPVQVVHGHAHHCALLSSGLVRCWGDNDLGQLGTGTLGIVIEPAH